jgi:heme/copper-type cytochrome/quinol oxidase subunit 4
MFDFLFSLFSWNKNECNLLKYVFAIIIIVVVVIVIIIIINCKWVYTQQQCAKMQDGKIQYSTIQYNTI